MHLLLIGANWSLSKLQILVGQRVQVMVASVIKKNSFNVLLKVVYVACVKGFKGYPLPQ